MKNQAPVRTAIITMIEQGNTSPLTSPLSGQMRYGGCWLRQNEPFGRWILTEVLTLGDLLRLMSNDRIG